MIWLLGSVFVIVVVGYWAGKIGLEIEDRQKKRAKWEEDVLDQLRR